MTSNNSFIEYEDLNHHGAEYTTLKKPSGETRR